MAEGEDFCAVGEWHGSFSWGVEGREDEDEQCHEGNMRSARFVDEQTTASYQQGPRHVWEREQQEASSAPFVNGPHGRPRKDEVGKTKAPGQQEGVGFVEAGLREDGRAVEAVVIL